jgi:hypothetical protein
MCYFQIDGRLWALSISSNTRLFITHTRLVCERSNLVVGREIVTHKLKIDED